MIAWTGSYAVPAGTEPVAISVQASGRTATVAFGGGHAVSTTVALGKSSKRIHFAFPGRPTNLRFDGTVERNVWSGTVRQGKLRGRFTLRRGASRILPLLGLYRGPSGTGLTIVQPLGGLPPWIVELPSGATHGIGSSLSVGDKLGDTSGNGRIAAELDRLHVERDALHPRRATPAGSPRRCRRRNAHPPTRPRTVPGGRDGARLGPTDAL